MADQCLYDRERCEWLQKQSQDLVRESERLFAAGRELKALSNSALERAPLNRSDDEDASDATPVEP